MQKQSKTNQTYLTEEQESVLYVSCIKKTLKQITFLTFNIEIKATDHLFYNACKLKQYMLQN
ncbi:hypothetical protein HanIR_Chr17g0903261 [Helianthus annuus]|nr:hypothetical protein HanIR_Chr17g0903261 [Helianthus annuus]